MKEKRLSTILESQNSPLARLTQSANEAISGEMTILNALPEQIRSQVNHASLADDGQLTLITASSAWCSRIRFEHDNLLDALKEKGIDASLIKVRVRPQSTPGTKP